MRFSGSRYWLLASAMGLVAGGHTLHAGTVATTNQTNKVIIYPSTHDSIQQLKQQGIGNVRNYGAYWLVEATDKQLAALKQRHGDRAVKANYLNRIELLPTVIDTTQGEPNIPEYQRESLAGGSRLRLIQFAGPVQPEWLDQVKRAGNVQVVTYIPNNAYVLRVDTVAEQKLENLRTPSGPIQWIGPFHPYYKLDPSLPKVAEPAIEVQVGIVDGPQAAQMLQAVNAFALEPPGKPSVLMNQLIARIKVNPADVTSIAQLPDVLWIQRHAPIEPRDEVQDLIMADRIRGTGNGPVPGFDDYLEFLLNIAGFTTNAAEYPILDDADTLADVTRNFNDFFELGNPGNPSRLVGFLNLCLPTATLCDNIHGPFVMSVASAYNDSKSNPVNLDANGFRKGLGVSPFGRISNTIVFNVSGSACVFCVPNSDHPSLRDIPLNEYMVLGARISNNSWGDSPVAGNGGNLGIYDADSQSYDVTVRDALDSGSSVVNTNGQTPPPPPFRLNQEMVTIFAAGNAQGLGSGNGGFGDIIVTPPATAKNVISVGASENVRGSDFKQCVQFPSEADNSFDISFFSSFGPTLDGRFKPEIVAPGAAIFGVDGLAAPFLNLVGTNLVEVTSNAYTCASGTSFAAPAVSGAAQLLWWWFQHRLQNEQSQNFLQPSPAMTKAYICNAARYLPITNPQTGAMDTLPSSAQGMGIIDVARMFDGVPRLIRDETTPRAIDTPLLATNPVPQQTFFSRSGQSYEVSGTVADPTQPLRATLAWTDAPGDPSKFKQLVNDLDLEVTIGGQVYRGNNFSGPDSVPVSVAPSVDSLNNMESVFLPAGQTGTWSVVVRAANIAGVGVQNFDNALGQDFALVVYNAAVANRSDVPNLSTNNSCQTALDITTFPFSFTNNLTKAVYRNVHPSPSAGRGGADEFFRIAQPTIGTQFSVDTFGSSFDTVLSVWRVRVVPESVFISGACGTLVELVSDNDAGGTLQSSVSFTADGSNDYYIVAEPHNDGPGGTLVLNVNTSASLITLSPTSLAFGSQIQGTTSAVQTVTYHNGYPLAVAVDSVSITGDNAADFTIISQTCVGTINAASNCVVSVAFVPQDVGPRRAYLVFTDSATGSPRTAPLSGTGTPPAPIVCAGPSPLVFTDTAVGTSSAAQSVVVTNCGTDFLTISSVVVSGTATNDFTLIQDCTSGAISPGGTCTISITFRPQLSGIRQATLVIASDASSSPDTVTLQGAAFTPSASICFGSGSVDFGGVGVGGTGSVQSVTITNCGTAPLVISSVTVTGANSNDFIKVSSTCTTVATGRTCVVNLQFSPSAGGTRSASLSVTDNSSGSPHQVPLVGFGALSQPDAFIGKTINTNKMVGLGIIDPTGTGIGQEVVQSVRRGASRGVKFYIAVKNVGSGDDRFLVQLRQIAGGPGFTANCFLNARPCANCDVTAAATAGTFSTGSLGPGAVTGEATMIRVEVFADKTVKKGTTATFTLTFSSAGDPTRQDTVRVTVVAK